MQSSAVQKLKQFARRLLECEAAAGEPANVQETRAFRVCEKLRGPLGKYMGSGGFRTLLARALALGLAGAETRWLGGLAITPDGALVGIKEFEVKLEITAVTEGEVVLVSQLMGLLVTFIGPAMTVSLLQDIWQELGELNF